MSTKVESVNEQIAGLLEGLSEEEKAEVGNFVINQNPYPSIVLDREYLKVKVQEYYKDDETVEEGVDFLITDRDRMDDYIADHLEQIIDDMLDSFEPTSEAPQPLAHRWWDGTRWQNV